MARSSRGATRQASSTGAGILTCSNADERGATPRLRGLGATAVAALPVVSASDQAGGSVATIRAMPSTPFVPTRSRHPQQTVCGNCIDGASCIIHKFCVSGFSTSGQGNSRTCSSCALSLRLVATNVRLSSGRRSCPARAKESRCPEAQHHAGTHVRGAEAESATTRTSSGTLPSISKRLPAPCGYRNIQAQDRINLAPLSSITLGTSAR